VLAEAQQPIGEPIKRVEAVGAERLAVDDREVELDLVEPGGVDREVDEPQVLPAALEPLVCSTSRPNGSIPVLFSTGSNRLAWWTSQAAR